MEKEVSRWLSHTFAYQTAADTQLSAACRGNLRALWDFLMSNYKSSEQKHSILNALEKRRREQEAARRAPELRQMAQQQRKQLADLQQKAEMLERTVASFQATAVNGVVDSIEQEGEHGLLNQDLNEPLAQVCLLKDYAQQLQQLLPLLRTRLDKLQTVAELARARCHKTASHKRLQHLLQQLQQINHRIQAEIFETLGGKCPDMDAASDLGQQQQPDQQQALLEYRSTDAGSTADGTNSSWEIVVAPTNPEPDTAGPWQNSSSGSLVSKYNPSEAVKHCAQQLLQEPPDALLICSSELADQASHELTAVLDEAETALLAPLGSNSSHSKGIGLSGEGHRGVACAADDADDYSLPWTTSWTFGGLGALVPVQQQHAGLVTPEMLVKQRQKAHVDMYMQAIKAQAAAQAADKELTLLLGSTPLLQQHLGMGSCSWEAELAGLWLRAERLRGEVGLLERHKQEFERDVDVALRAESQLQETWEHIQATVREEQELNALLWQVSKDNSELYTLLYGQQEEVLNMLRQQLVPCNGAAAHHAQAGKDEVQREVAVLDRLQVTVIGILQTLGAQRAAAGKTGAHVTEGSTPTLIRLETAAQRLSHMGRPTTAGKVFGAGTGIGRHGGAGSAALSLSLEGLHGIAKDCAVDNAAVSALSEAAAVDDVAPVMCPEALLSKMAGEGHKVRQLHQQIQQLTAVHRTAASNRKEAEQQTAPLSTQVNELRAKDQAEVLPLLNELSAQNQDALDFIRTHMQKEMNNWKEQPAFYLLKDHQVGGKTCAEWLTDIKVLHVKKRQLSGQLT